MILTGAALKAALIALDEGRLWWRVTDQYGRSCNGGDRSFRLDPARPGQPGAWAPHIGTVSMCRRGYHATSDPVRWQGLRVALVEPWDCFDVRLWVAASRPLLYGANLGGANLYGANLDGANLDGASLGDWERGSDGYARKKEES